MPFKGNKFQILRYHENKAQATEAIREVKAHCLETIREVEAACLDHTQTIQQSHSGSMQCLEREAIEEEGRDHQSFLAACGVDLQACPPEAHGVLMYPLQLLMGNMSLATLLAIPPQTSTAKEEPTPVISHPTTLVAPTSETKWQCHSPTQEVSSPWSGDKVVGTSEELPHQKHKNGMPLRKLLEGGWQKACAKNPDLVQKARGVSFKTNHPNFNLEVSHDLSQTFWEMADSAGLFRSDIYEVQDAWTGWKDLCTTNHAAKASQRNICLVTPTESPNIMGLEGIHSLEALHRWGGCSYCLWCAKEGQNEGTIVSHLQTVHYCLGLVSTLCLAFFTTSADTMRKHGPQYKVTATGDWKEEETSEEDNGDEDDRYLP